MGIEIPSYLQWVSYLVGSEWPQGDETAMFRIGEDWRASADDLAALIPDLNRVRSETMSVLIGQTADAADDQFRMLFDGDYSVDKLAEAMSAMGDLAENCGTQIEYTKLQILTSLAIAAAEIAYAISCIPPTYGASAAWIPVTEAVTMMTVRQLVAMLLRQIAQRVAQALAKTMVRRMVREAAEEVVVGLGQELAIQGYQAAQGHRDGIDWRQAGTVGAASAVGGAAAVPVHAGMRRMLGDAKGGGTGAVKGAVSEYTAGVAGNVAGTVATGGELDPISVFGGAASSAATGAARGGRGVGGGPSYAGPAHPDAPSDAAASPGPDFTDPEAFGANGQQPHGGDDQSPSSTPTSRPDETSGEVATASDETSDSQAGTASQQDTTTDTAPSSTTTNAGRDGGPPSTTTTTHAPPGPDSTSSQPNAGPSTTTSPDTSGTEGPPAQHSSPITDTGIHSADNQQVYSSTHSQSITSTDTGTPQPGTPQSSQPAAAGSSAPGASSTSSQPATGTPATPAPSQATSQPTGTPAAPPRPSLSEPHAATAAKHPAGTPVAQRTDTPAGQAHPGHDAGRRPDAQQHQDPGPSLSDTTIPPVAVMPALWGGDGDNTRSATPAARSGLPPGDRIGPPHDRSGGPAPRDDGPSDRDPARARDSEATDHTAPERREAAQIVDDLENHRTDPTNSDAAAANREAQAVRDLAGARTDRPAIQLFGHPYGSTTTAYAGRDGRLKDYISSVTLLGSPGVGPLSHTRDFGIGPDNVYVASSSRDFVTFFGAVEPSATNRSGRLARVGLGFDPTMAEFGANRLKAEYSSPELTRGVGAHTNYYASEAIGADGTPALLRDAPTARVTESLDNFSHILTGNTDRINLEVAHRDPTTARFADAARARVAEPATGYPGNDCAPRTIEGFKDRHPDTPIRQVDGDYGGRGVPRSDYERALGTPLRDASLDDIIAAARNGQSVIVVDTYHMEGLPHGHPGSHTYSVEPNPDDPSRPLVFEGNERVPRPWPPQGLDHVAHTRIATFHPDGTPTHPMTEQEARARQGDDERISGERRESDDVSPDHHSREADYPPDHVSHLLGLPGYHPGPRSDVDARSVYMNGEHGMQALYDDLVARGADPETRAHTMLEARNELRSWARELMSDREGAARLARDNPNHSWDDVVAKYSERGLTGDDLYNTITERSMASRASVNERLGLDPNRPPPLSEVHNDRIGAAPPTDGTSTDGHTDVRGRPQYADEHLVEFKEGSTENTRSKRAEYERQIARQIDGLNEMTADELLHNMDNVKRDGLAQTQAREEYREALFEEELEAALLSEETDPEALGGLTPEEYAAHRTDETMALLAALHEPDIVAGGPDEIRYDEDGLPSMGDKFVNSSIGSQWRHHVADLRAYAEEMVRQGHGGDRLNVRWALNARR